MNIIPQPKLIKENDDGFFTLAFGIKLVNIKQNIEKDFNDFLQKCFLKSSSSSGSIVASIDKSLTIEGYVLKVFEKEISISGGDESGIFYALQTLKQLVVEYEGKIPTVQIEDSPLYPFRAFMLDVGRYFYPVSDVKKFLDLMALHKLNIFHWHLTEDQGWRVQSDKYPLLTEIGSKISHTNFGCKPHGGFYTKEELKEVVDYAHSLYIKVIPEFDIPGHTVSALAGYPELGCFNRKLEVANHWGVKHDILCAGKEGTYRFVFDIIDELCEIFKDGYFHIGGDEAVKTRWKLCPDCQKAIKDLGLRNEEDLQQFFMSKVNRYLKEKGYKSIIWNWDIAHGIEHLDNDIVWQFCGTANDELTVNAVNDGLEVIISTCFANYLDFPHSWANLKMSYENEPELKGVKKENLKNIIGIEAPLWTEYVPNMKKAYRQTFPRLGAIAEIAWTSKENRDFDKFTSKLESYFKLLDIYQVDYSTYKQSMPNKLTSFFLSLWFNRRQLHWEGLHNLIDNARVKRMAKKMQEKV